VPAARGSVSRVRLRRRPLAHFGRLVHHASTGQQPSTSHGA
jgi:hypothetical protein